MVLHNFIHTIGFPSLIYMHIGVVETGGMGCVVIVPISIHQGSIWFCSDSSRRDRRGHTASPGVPSIGRDRLRGDAAALTCYLCLNDKKVQYVSA